MSVSRRIRLLPWPRPVAPTPAPGFPFSALSGLGALDSDRTSCQSLQRPRPRRRHGMGTRGHPPASAPCGGSGGGGGDVTG